MKPSIKRLAFVLLTGFFLYSSCTKEYSCENCRGTDRPPIARAGADITISLPKDSILLDGSASSDPDGPITSYKWTGITGPGTGPGSSGIASPDSPKTPVRALMAGVYSFELTVTDSAGLSSKDTIRVTVKDPAQPNRPPVADVGADLADTLPNNAITLDGRASHDPDNNIASYAWRKISGPDAFNLSHADLAQAQLTGLVQGIYYFELTVTDAEGLFSKDTVKVQVIVKPPPDQAAHTGTTQTIIITLPMSSVFLSAPDPGSYVNAQCTYLSGPAGSHIANVDDATWLFLAKDLVPGSYSFRLTAGSGAASVADTINVLVVDDPNDLNTITFKLRWRLADEYGLGIQAEDILSPFQPNMFNAGSSASPMEVYLQTDPASPWLTVPYAASAPVSTGILYVYDASGAYVWITRFPEDDTWLGQEASLKVKFL